MKQDTAHFVLCPYYRDIQSVESGIGESIREGDESRVSKHTSRSNQRRVKWDNITDHSENDAGAPPHGEDEEKKSRRKKKRDKKEKVKGKNL